MYAPNPGVGLALTTGFCWALAPLFWASAGRRISAFHINLIRMLIAAVVLAVAVVPYAQVTGASLRPSILAVLWLAGSGVVHMAIGDAFYYESILRLGPRRAVQFLTLFPVFAALVAWFFLDEQLSDWALIGMGVVLCSLSYLAYAEGKMQNHSREPGAMSVAGVVCGVLASLCIGALLSKITAVQDNPGMVSRPAS